MHHLRSQGRGPPGPREPEAVRRLRGLGRPAARELLPGAGGGPRAPGPRGVRLQAQPGLAAGPEGELRRAQGPRVLRRRALRGPRGGVYRVFGRRRGAATGQ